MFTVEWLKDGKPVHREAMLGSKLADVLRLAHERLPTALEASGMKPDSIRVTDHMSNQTTLETIIYDGRGEPA